MFSGLLQIKIPWSGIIKVYDFTLKFMIDAFV